MSGINPCFKSRVEKAKTRVSGFQWYVYTPQGEHIWAESWRDALIIGNSYARMAQMEVLR